MNIRSVLPASPSATLVSAIDSPGSASPSVIVPVALIMDRVALIGLLKLSVRVSSSSASVSPNTGTVTVVWVAPAAIVAVPDVAV